LEKSAYNKTVKEWPRQDKIAARVGVETLYHAQVEPYFIHKI